MVDAVGKTGYFGEEAGELELLGLDGSEFRQFVNRLFALLLASIIAALLFLFLLILIAAIPILVLILISILLLLLIVVFLLALFILVLLVLLLFLFLLIADFFLLVTHITIAI